MRKNFLILPLLIILSCSKDPVMYTLTVQTIPNDGGVVSPSAKQYREGEIASITAISKSEYIFESWTGVQETAPSIKILMNSDKIVTANFIKKKYALNVEIEGEGTVVEKVIQAGVATDYNSGTIVELTASPKDEWEFKEWKGDLTGSENPKQIKIDKAKFVKAVFVKKQYSLNIEILGEGTVEKKVIRAGVATDYNSGSIIELTAKSDNGWEFVKWNGDAKSFQNTIQITVNKEINLIVEFANTNRDFLYNENTIIQGYGVIWGMDVLGLDEIIFTERSGKIYLFKSGIIIELNGFPNDKINAVGQHGLLDVLKHPDYKENGFIYAVYSEKVEGFETSKLNLVRFKVDGNTIINLESIFKINELTTNTGHFGSRITFDNDYLYLSVGEGSPSTGGINTPYDNAQNINTNWGKIHRLNYNGTIPTSNPKFDKEYSSSIFSMGHRNPQGLTFNPYTNEILSSEHGPQGGDEVNIIKSGLNYGWPYVSYGVNYGGGDISGRSHEGYEKPIYYWDPSIATSNLILLKDNNHNNWFKNLLVCGMKTDGIYRLDITDSNNVKQLEFINLGERTRNIREGINGNFYVSTDSGKIIKFSPTLD